MPQSRWFDRTFELGLPVSAAPSIVERLRRTPDRLDAAVRHLPARVTTARREDRWSINENAGHLLDLEPLWLARLDDFEAGHNVLTPTDLQNRKTHEANHNARRLAEILDDFRALRGATLARLQSMDNVALARTAKHPRLNQPMSVVDLAFFVAEHDDHHLRTIADIAASLGDGK